MDAYVILRRNGWRTAEDLEERPPTRSIPRRSLDPQLRAGGAGRTPRHDLHLPGLQPGAVGRHAGAASLRRTKSSRSPIQSSCDPTQPQLPADKGREGK